MESIKYPKGYHSQSIRHPSENIPSINVKVIGIRKRDSDIQFSWSSSTSYLKMRSTRKTPESTKWCQTWSSPETQVSVEATTKKCRSTGTQSKILSLVLQINTSLAFMRRSRRNTLPSLKLFFRTLTSTSDNPLQLKKEKKKSEKLHQWNLWRRLK